MPAKKAAKRKGQRQDKPASPPGAAKPAEKAAKRKRTKKGRPRPLEGMRVLDLTQLLPGPAATLMLANFGAEVIKVEKPGEGDAARGLPPEIDGLSALFLAVNRGKKSIALDLQKKAGREAFLLLAKKADIIVDGFRPGVMLRLGLGHEKLRRANPRLIYAALSGYGQSGPLAQTPGHDLNYLAHGGALDLLARKDGTPLIPGMQIADIAGGALPAVIGILLALQAREKTGKGQLIDAAMLDGVLGLLHLPLAVYTSTRRKPKRGNERLFGKYACYNIYPVRNGRFLVVGALEPKFWAELCNILERPELIAEQYAEGDRQRVVIAELTRLFQRKEARDWEEIFRDKDVCVSMVRDIGEVTQDEHLRERGSIVALRQREGPVHHQVGVYPKLAETPGVVGEDAPHLGEHTEEILRSAGVAAKKLAAMLKSGAAAQWAATRG